MFGRKRYTSRRGNWSSVYGKRRYSGRWGSTYRKSVGSARAAKAGNKLAYYNGSVNGSFQFVVPTGSFYSDVHMFCPFAGALTMSGSGSSASYILNEGTGVHGGILNDRGFRLMCHQYDECRLTRVAIKMSCGVSASTSFTNSIKVHSIVDRNFTYKELQAQASTAMTDQEKIDFKSIVDNPGDVVFTWNNNSYRTMNRYCSPTDLKEKEAWVDSSVEYTGNAGLSPLTQMYNHGWYNGNCEFAPTFMYCIQQAAAPSAYQSVPVTYSIEYCFAFRNPRSGLDRFIVLEATGYTNPSTGSKGVIVEEVEKKAIEDKKEEEENTPTQPV